MRILIASSAYAPAMNGQAVFTTNLAEGLARRNHEVIVVMDSPNGKASRSEVNGVVIQELRSIYFKYFSVEVHFSAFPVRGIKQIIKSFQPEIVHVQDHFPICRNVARTARKLGIKTVGSNHFLPENFAPYIPAYSALKPIVNWILWQWMLAVYKHTDAISAQSLAAARIIQRQKLSMPILPISCGIDLERFHPDPSVDRQVFRQRYGIDSQKKTFMFLGRVDAEKRVDLLIRAAHKLSRKDIQLVIGGSGRAQDEMHRLADELQVTDKVRFTGFISRQDLPRLLNSIDVFVMPSEAELLSISTLEAMACARPVLLANVLALPELVRVGENGYLFEPGDVENLVLYMNILADHHERWGKMGMVSREVAQAHSLDETVKKFEKLYTQLITQGEVNEVNLGIGAMV
jgi:1,2-diacylglycerol 3-alpha-glucosyltransferase